MISRQQLFVLCVAGFLSAEATALRFHTAEVVAPLPRVKVCPGSSAAAHARSIATWARGGNCSDAPFQPRGANYSRLNQTSVGLRAEANARPGTNGRGGGGRGSGGFRDGPGNASHSTFSIGHWNRSEANEALARMSSLSFNLVRVFIDDGRTLCGLRGNATVAAAGTDLSLVPVIPCTPKTTRPNGVNGPFFPAHNNSSVAPVAEVGIAHPDWLSSEYMDNFAEFVILAATHGIYVMPILQRFPCNSHFATLVQELNTSRVSEGNSDYLYEPAVEAKAAYMASFVRALKNRIEVGLLTTIFGFSLENEARGYGNEPPFNVGSVTVLDAHEVARNMSAPNDRRALLDVAFANWANTFATAVWEIDRDAMVTAGMFTYFAVGWPTLQPLGQLASVTNDFLRTLLSSAPTVLSPTLTFTFIPQVQGLNFSDDVQSENFAQIERSKMPILMGEFGAFRTPYSTLSAAVKVLEDTVVQACSTEFGFQGWLVWTWDCFEQSWMLWNLADTGEVNGTNTSLAELLSLVASCGCVNFGNESSSFLCR